MSTGFIFKKDISEAIHEIPQSQNTTFPFQKGNLITDKRL